MIANQARYALVDGVGATRSNHETAIAGHTGDLGSRDLTTGEVRVTRGLSQDRCDWSDTPSPARERSAPFMTRPSGDTIAGIASESGDMD